MLYLSFTSCRFKDYTFDVSLITDVDYLEEESRTTYRTLPQYSHLRSGAPDENESPSGRII